MTISGTMSVVVIIGPFPKAQRPVRRGGYLLLINVSTASLASANPVPVSSRYALIAWIFFAGSAASCRRRRGHDRLGQHAVSAPGPIRKQDARAQFKRGGRHEQRGRERQTDKKEEEIKKIMHNLIDSLLE